MVIATFIKYILLVIELRSEDPWEARPVYLAYLNLMSGKGEPHGSLVLAPSLSYNFFHVPPLALFGLTPPLFPPTDFLRLVTYCIFFLILFNFYSFPLHILRELFVTVTSFIKRLKDIIRARRATANLNTR